MTTATELQFADDAAFVGSSREQIERVAQILDEVATKWGLTVSLPKTKLVVAGKCNEEDMQLIVIRGANSEVISEFKYLGSVVEAQGERDPER